MQTDKLTVRNLVADILEACDTGDLYTGVAPVRFVDGHGRAMEVEAIHVIEPHEADDGNRTLEIQFRTP